MRAFQPGIPWEREVCSRQTVRPQAGVSQLPVARQKIGGGCWPLLDGRGKKNKVSSVLEVK